MSLNYSDQGLGPVDLMLISSLAIPVSPALTEINLSGNLIDASEIKKLPATLSGVNVVCLGV